jgi:hypothetical protein
LCPVFSAFSVSDAALCLYRRVNAILSGVEMQLLWKIADFGRAVRRRMKFGNLSRASIKILRVQWQADCIACDWLARAADEWDADLASHVSEEHASLQALQDAMALRELLFAEWPHVETAQLRAFRQGADGRQELIITGTVTRDGEVSRRIASTAMRAKLLGFQFWFEGKSLTALESEECAMSF